LQGRCSFARLAKPANYALRGKRRADHLTFAHATAIPRQQPKVVASAGLGARFALLASTVTREGPRAPEVAALDRFLAHLGPVANRVAISAKKGDARASSWRWVPLGLLLAASGILSGCGMSGAGSAMPAGTISDPSSSIQTKFWEERDPEGPGTH